METSLTLERCQTGEVPTAHSHSTLNFFIAVIKSVPTLCGNFLFMVYLPMQVSELPKSRKCVCLVYHVSLAMSTEGLNF